MIISVILGIVERKRRNHSTQNIHRQGMLRRQPQKIKDGWIELAFARQPLAKHLELIGIGQMSKPQEMADLLEGRVVGQIVDVISAVGKHPLLAVDVTDARGGGDNAFQSFGGVQAGNARHGSSLTIRMLYVRSVRKNAAEQPSFIRQSGRSFQASSQELRPRV